ncbi:DJ-1 family glyoxalase III [Atopobacter phocae]|uniref:DJ-1 family glyoxalase III n=1 Tax=Atopobacter phocae TaxID=136492 RepID=UPI000471C873|nr:DJ-1 family glyoxalase III [Atopobacter phocae]
MKQVSVLLADGFETVEALIPVDILRRGGVSVELVSVMDRLDVWSAQQVAVQADCMWADRKQNVDLIMIPGGTKGAETLRDDVRVIEWLQSVNLDHTMVAAICAGPIVLDRANLLANHQFTTFPGVEQELATNLENYQDQVVVKDGSLITSRGPAPAFPFGLELLASLEGTERALEVYQAMQGPMVFAWDPLK